MSLDTQVGDCYNEKYSNFERLLSNESTKTFKDLIQIFISSGLDINTDIDIISIIGRWQLDNKSLINFQEINPSLKDRLDDLLEELDENNIKLSVSLYRSKANEIVETHSQTDRFNMGDN